MPRHQLILPQADAACGKLFFADRRTADGHRIALEVWNRATGRVREGYRLAVYRCKRCAGFHIGTGPSIASRSAPVPDVPDDLDRDERDRSMVGDTRPRHRPEVPSPETAWS